ncbi:calcineurin-like phosphoesterase family protein [Sphingobacterium sp. SYP-B4668]|uniref:calcineurin-like phosphoesterase family protein n=1 Tax=Sphingobacterium sp. SYP-B4668 TaxID=2996035 RepID=UPI0022DDFF15|nr:calcineurin-like phosphoesterase family protein [Sphingobacterium sp. SYP-B4668]
MKRLTILCWFVSLFSVVVSYAQSVSRSVQGRVTTTNGGALANISVTDGRTIVLTDKNGNYRLTTAPGAKHVYITIPGGYRIPIRDYAPCFYLELNDAAFTRSYDFQLEPTLPDDRHAMIVVGDPQVYTHQDVEACRPFIQDMQKYISSHLEGYPVHGMVTGDMVGDKPELFVPLKEVFSDIQIPFFYAKGNHDIQFGTRSNIQADLAFQKYFGPNYYAFNRGKIHYVVLDNVFYLGRAQEYISYLPEEQLAWLEQDLKQVSPGSTVVLMLHIPTTNKAFRKSEGQQVLKNSAFLYDLLQPYQVHIISGHTHLQDHHRPAPHIWEHTQSSISGIFWQGPDCADGTPPGYMVYMADGNQLSWKYKALGLEDHVQSRVYAVGDNPERPDDLTVLIWNYDPTWTVSWYEDDVYRGAMQNYIGRDPQTTKEIIKNKKTYSYDWIWTTETDHLFFARPQRSGSKLTVEIRDGFGNISKEYVQ